MIEKNPLKRATLTMLADNAWINEGHNISLSNELYFLFPLFQIQTNMLYSSERYSIQTKS